MALVRCDFFSEVLEVGTSMTVLLPQASEEQIGVVGDRRATGDVPVLYLLHGLTRRQHRVAALHQHRAVRRAARPRRRDAAGAAQLLRRRGARRAATGRSCPRSCPTVVGSFFRVSERREDTFVAGLSMGGYGALKWALHQPERFAAAASLSGALDLVRAQPRRPRDGRCSSGSSTGAVGPHDDLFALLADADVETLPSLLRGLRHRGPPLRRERAVRRRGRRSPGSTCTWTSGPASTSGACGTRRSATSSPGCRCDR